jgi:hypothetical protein
MVEGYYKLKCWTRAVLALAVWLGSRNNVELLFCQNALFAGMT